MEEKNSKLKKLRKELGYTQVQFADILSMSLSGYKKVEYGYVQVTTDKIELLNEKFGISADDILFEPKNEYIAVWEEASHLSEEEKWMMFFRMYVYLSKKSRDEEKMLEMMKHVDHAVEEFLAQNSSGE